ncbi:MAG: hypothetical protein A4E42_00258 [Methanoregulaceae archaeon PtaU1.Bin222]|nr:MAG: hypothetical protein A4E42_00258 [Methanoregulaceae archaeon PtaU1.Bin222]
MVSPVALTLVTNASVNFFPARVGCMAFFTGKFLEDVTPVIYEFPAESTATPFPASTSEPPRNSEKKIWDPLLLIFKMNASWVPPNGVRWVNPLAGKSEDQVLPVRYMFPALSSAMAFPESSRGTPT